MREIPRNIAITSAIFIIAFSIILITNYFQVRNSNALEMIETLKQSHEEYGDSSQLQEENTKVEFL